MAKSFLAWSASAGALLMTCAAGSAQAQSIPDVNSLPGGLFTVNIRLGPNAAPTVNDTYVATDADFARDFFDQNALAARYPGYNGAQEIRGVLNIRGVPISARFAAGSNTLIVEAPALADAGCVDPPDCFTGTLTFDGQTRQDAFNQFDDYFDAEGGDAEDFLERLFRAFARSSPVDPLAGNPDSVQGRLIRGGLDLTSADSAMETDYRSGGQRGSTPWLVGVDGGVETGGVFEGARTNLIAQKGWRIFEGNRARLKLDLPISYATQEEARQAQIVAALALEVPVLEERWSIEGRIAYGAAVAPEALSVGHMAGASLTSRLRVDLPGRGHAIVGNMVGYTQTLGLGIDEDVGFDVNPDIANTVVRNGVAYEYPIKAQVLGRQPSVRASYTHTLMTGDDLFLEQYHEVSSTLGVRGREEGPRSGQDLLRVGAVHTFGEDYQSTAVNLGWRF